MESITNIIFLAKVLLCLPGILLEAIIAFIKNKFFGYQIPDRSSEEKFGWSIILFSLLFWVVGISWLVYESKFTTIEYSYACPVDNSVKCYELRTDLYTDEGRTYIEKAYFPNGGYLTFDYCNDIKDAKVECYTEDGEAWAFQHAKTVRVRK